MKKTSHAYATYWRTCLVDADLDQGAYSKKAITEFNFSTKEERESGKISADLVTQFFTGKPCEVEYIEVTFRPYVYVGQLLEHGKFLATGIPEIVTPIVSHGVVDRKGYIFPNNTIFIPRDILEPLDIGVFAIGTINDLDKWLEKNNAPYIDHHNRCNEGFEDWHKTEWTTYLNYCQAMLNTVAKGWPEKTDPFELEERWIIVSNTNIRGANQHIVALYDHSRKENPSTPLFDKYASEENTEPEPCFPLNSLFSNRIGHSSDSHSLTDAQRDAMSHQIASDHGDIIGINGPPGTGKTTLILSVVASHWVHSVLAGTEPPVIVAASTNNQAVTNIIDAFAKDFSQGTGAFAGRWIPDITSFGAYFPSTEIEKQVVGKYQTKTFFDSLEEPSYVNRAKAAFLKAASAAFPDLSAPSLQEVVSRLHLLVKHESDRLSINQVNWERFQQAKYNLVTELGETPFDTLRTQKNTVDETQNQLSHHQALKDKWEFFLAHESWIYALFSWMPPVGKKRLLLAKSYLKSCWPGVFPAKIWTNIDDFSIEIDHLISILTTTLKQQQLLLQRALLFVQSYQETQHNWHKCIESLFPGRQLESVNLADCDRAADTAIRFQAFLYATHYWEGRWLIEMDSILPTLFDEKKKMGPAAVEKRWRRRMKLTPCVVSTFFILPKEMLVSRYDKGAFVPDYLYNFIDLLIVDEAGQVLPEVAGASFTLAKRAMVIGDTLQIEPIWGIHPQVDIGNLIYSGVMDGKDARNQYKKRTAMGKVAASGSVMKIAQEVSRYHYNTKLARGMYLYENRRCYNEIIEYCNVLCYQKALLPKRGNAPNNENIPVMGYLHINGICQTQRGSRQNILEAETIAAWIVFHKEELEQKYSKRIDQIIAIVTPFSSQAIAITNACREKGLKVGKKSGEMTVGTVHSLQGAERLIVIFSPTYSKHNNGTFIDSSPSMLNVAVSRAKDNFLVFGDMETFNPNETTPRGLLASFLLKEETNALTFAPLPREDIYSQSNELRHLYNAKQHDEFLFEVLANAKHEVHIVSPWVFDYRLMDEEFLKKLRETIKRDVSVTVYADKNCILKLAKDFKFKYDLWKAITTVLDNEKVNLINVPRLHSKIVMQDRNWLCMGSFNWLSASRNTKNANHETSIAYTSPHVRSEIQFLLTDLSKRAEKS